MTANNNDELNIYKPMDYYSSDPLGFVLADGHTMFKRDVVKDLNDYRRGFLTQKHLVENTPKPEDVDELIVRLEAIISMAQPDNVNSKGWVTSSILIDATKALALLNKSDGEVTGE